MTHPSQIYFAVLPKPVILIRTLLFCTAKRGCVIESMYVTLRTNETRQNFNIWVSGSNNDLTRASGLYVGESGVVIDHHFLTPHDDSFRFCEGKYHLEVFAKLVDQSRTKSIWSHELHISHDQALALKKDSRGIFFDWGPEAGSYLTHVSSTKDKDGAEDPLEGLKLAKEVMLLAKQFPHKDSASGDKV